MSTHKNIITPWETKMMKREKTYLLGMQQCFWFWDEYERSEIVRHYYKSLGWIWMNDIKPHKEN